MARRALAVTALAMLMASPTLAQEQSVEDRLRDALRKSTIELRALQDGTAGLQAQLDQTTKQRDLLQQQQLDAAAAKLVAQPAAPAVPVAPNPELVTLRDAVQQLRQQNAVLQQGLSKWQGAYAQAAALAQAKDTQSRASDAALTAQRQTLGVCVEKNKRLLATAGTILHLYETQDFRSILLRSYEPLLGLKRVELETIVQAYDDRIRDQAYYGHQPPQPATAPGQ